LYLSRTKEANAALRSNEKKVKRRTHDEKGRLSPKVTFRDIWGENGLKTPLEKNETWEDRVGGGLSDGRGYLLGSEETC